MAGCAAGQMPCSPTTHKPLKSHALVADHTVRCLLDEFKNARSARAAAVVDPQRLVFEARGMTESERASGPAFRGRGRAHATPPPRHSGRGPPARFLYYMLARAGLCYVKVGPRCK